MSRPLRVVALGDSIMWGQGNADQDKFVQLVCNALGQHDYEVRFTSLAHSGAVVVPTKSDDHPGIWGEVPESAPSISYQLDAVPDPTTVDVLLLDGGINDVSAFSIVVADPFDPHGLANLTAHTTAIFAGPVERLIAAAVTTCPNARIVVTGYYPIISDRTDLRQLVQLMKHFPRPIGTPNFLDRTAEHLSDEFLEVAIKSERERIIVQSQQFAELSTTLLNHAVAPYAERVFVADPGFGPEHAFAAPNTWLWSGVDDPLARQRAERYAQHLATAALDWPLYTPVASLCHPNRAGSEAYATAIQRCLRQAGILP